MRSRMVLVLLVVVVIPSLASAAKLHRCVAPDDAVSIQSAPCPAGHRTDWVREVTPAPEPPPARSNRPRSANAPRRTTHHAQPVYRAEAHDPKQTACIAARESAQHARDKYWNKLDFEGRRRLDEQVRLACR